MTAIEKRVLVILVAAFALGAAMTAYRRGLQRGMPSTVVVTNPAAECSTVPLIDVNTASQYELEALPGIGPVTASRVIAYRVANGPFGSVEELLKVPGIGPGRLGAIRDLVTASEPDSE